MTADACYTPSKVVNIAAKQEPQHTTRIVFIPDTQARPGDDFKFLEWIGKYLVKLKPDVIVHGGDFADMPSLSTHDAPGSKGMEGLRYKADVASVREAMDTLMKPIKDEQERLRANKKAPWRPRMVMTLGNHENRIDRAIQNDPRLEGLISVDDLEYEKYGWEVIPFLKPIVIDGIVFCHYFCSGQMGRAVGTAQKLLQVNHMSSIAAHQQGYQITRGKKGDGTPIVGIIAGSCYLHDEGYLNYQTNNHWRGLIVCNDVVDGTFDEMPITLRYLERKYGNA